jgi:hypothetical protein
MFAIAIVLFSGRRPGGLRRVADVMFAATPLSVGAGVAAVTESESPGTDDGGRAANRSA